MGKTLFRVFSFLIIGYIIICTVMFSLQRQLMYHPEKITPDPQDWNAKDMSIVQLITEDDLPLRAWYETAEQGKPTLIYFHGNAGHLGMRVDKLRPLLDKGYGLLLLSYRGYGGNPGSPSEDGLYADARAAVRFLEDQQIPMEKIIFYGESLGTGVAVQMGAEYPEVSAVVLESPFTSMVDAAQLHYPYLPVRQLVTDRYDSISKVKKIKAPLLIMHGAQDTLVPITMGKKLLDAANEPKSGVFFDDLGHSEFVQVTAPTVEEFIQNYVQPVSIEASNQVPAE